ncbi:MAG: D-alanyl-D-alanine carboxypeptidase family protein [Lachnospiraceae bacterium]
MKYIKKITCTFLTGILAVSAMASSAVVHAAEDTIEAERQAAYEKAIDSDSWENWPAGPSVYAESAIVMEAETGMILYAKDIDARNYPASITKIMTALVTLENCDLDEEVLYSYYATHSIEYGSSSIARTEGEILTVEESLYGLMLSSANECANALAEHVAGSVEDFAVLMNKKAEELGCTNTHFANANGLHDENHYTSAHDMALITQAAIADEDFRRICGEDYYLLRSTNKNDEELPIQNHHYMISNYKTSKYLDDTVFAGKTGYTSNALHTLVTCASRNGMEVIVVTMRTRPTGVTGEPLFSDTALLLDYADNFQKLNIAANESTFTVNNAYSFQMDSDEFRGSASLISIDPDSSIILPKNVSFSEAKPSLALDEDSDDSAAYLTYEYAGQPVGKAAVTLAKNEIQDFSFDETESGEKVTDDAVPQKTNFIIVNFKVIMILLIAVLILMFLFLSIRRFYIRNRAKILKAIRIYRKRKFNTRRRRRRSRKF